MGKLAATQSTDKLFELIDKSSLLAPKPLEQAKQICAENPDPKMAARRLIKEGLLTDRKSVV